MKNFIKSVFASCLGSVLALCVLGFVLFGMAAAVSGGGEGKTYSNGVLELKFDQAIPEKTDNIPMDYSSFDFERSKMLGLRDILRLIDHAKTDDNIKGISLNIKSTPGGLTTMSSVEKALTAFKESGKFIYAYSDDYHQLGYLLSSTADSIMINPNGMVDLKGFAVMYPFFKDGLDKLGIEYEIFYAGDFKSATEPYRRMDMSDNNKAQTRLYLNDVIQPFKQTIIENRGLSSASLEDIIGNYLGRTSTSALENGLVDVITYRDEYDVMLSHKLGLEEDDDVNYISMIEYFNNVKLVNKGSYKNKVAVIYAEGTVTYDTEGKGEISDVTFIKMLKKIRKDKNIKAVVLRVNSPGGSAFTADVVLREIDLIKMAGKPVVASFGDYAASAGYYIAATADSILAEENTLTGSIGVYSMIPIAAKLANKLGVAFDTVKTHDFAVGLSNVLEMSEKQKTILAETTEEVYDQFLSVVARGRGMDKEDVHEIAQGKIWSGVKAKENGLVDDIGSLEDAIAIAASMAEMEDNYKVVEYPRFEMSPIENILTLLNQSSIENAGMNIIEKISGEKLGLLKIKRMMESKSPQALMPYELKLE